MVFNTTDMYTECLATSMQKPARIAPGFLDVFGILDDVFGILDAVFRSTECTSALFREWPRTASIGNSNNLPVRTTPGPVFVTPFE